MDLISSGQVRIIYVLCNVMYGCDGMEWNGMEWNRGIVRKGRKRDIGRDGERGGRREREKRGRNAHPRWD